MSRIVVSDDYLQGADPGYVQRLKDKKRAVQQAMAKIARYVSVRRTIADDGQGHTLFRLLTYDRSNCMALFTPLDLTFTAKAFERITEGKRSCS